jgi:hypothetical protein
MNIPNHQIDADSDSNKLDSESRLMHLLTGLVRQKEELGPIADELIDVLQRLGVEARPQAIDKSQSSKP